MATAAPITTYSDREFLFRLQTLVVDGGTEVLRTIFDQRLQNQPLNVVLANERSTINRLRRQNTLTRVQYDSLYPSSGQLPTSSDLDITLIVCLLRNLPCLGCNQNYNWNVPPQTGDTSVEADVCRLRVFRNEIAHISSTTGFQQSSFEAKWREIETVLLRLDQNSPIPSFSQTIDSYKYNPMDPANEQKIRTMIEQWQERHRGLETDMQLIKKDVSDTKESVKRLEKDFSDTKEDVKRIKKDFSDTREDIKTIKKDFSDTKENVKSIKKEFSYTKEDVKSIKKDFSNTQEDVKTIKKDVIYLRQGKLSSIDDIPELLEWLTPASQVATQDLHEDSFEHLTQASTGATTGDWFVLFFKPGCEECMRILPSVETAAINLKHKMNFAKVDVASNKKLAERFKITTCPYGILFKQGKMYLYEPAKFDTQSLISFTETWYKNVKSLPVPKEPTTFDILTETIAMYIKEQVDSPDKKGICVSGVIFICVALIIVVMCVFRKPADSRRKHE